MLRFTVCKPAFAEPESILGAASRHIVERNWVAINAVPQRNDPPFTLPGSSNLPYSNVLIFAISHSSCDRVPVKLFESPVCQTLRSTIEFVDTLAFCVHGWFDGCFSLYPNPDICMGITNLQIKSGCVLFVPYFPNFCLSAPRKNLADTAAGCCRRFQLLESLVMLI